MLDLGLQAVLPLTVALTDPDATCVIEQQLSASLRPVAGGCALAVVAHLLVLDASKLGKNFFAISLRRLLWVIDKFDHISGRHRVGLADGIVPLVDA